LNRQAGNVIVHPEPAARADYYLRLMTGQGKTGHQHHGGEERGGFPQVRQDRKQSLHEPRTPMNRATSCSVL
jgi:hypothetical protein